MAIRSLVSFERYLTRLGKYRFLHPKYLDYAFASCGSLCILFFFAGFIAAGFIPPARPWWSAERTAAHYDHHRVGMHVGAVLLVTSGMFFLPYLTIISAQMRRIPNVPWTLPILQLASRAASVWTFMITGIIRAIGAFREREPALTELMNDAYWLFAIMPFQTFWPMSWAWSYAILVDDREKPMFPKFMGVVNFFAPLMFGWSIAIHATKSEPFAWNGALGFWVPAVMFGVQYGTDTYYLFRAIHDQYRENDDSSLDEVHGTKVLPVVQSN